MALSPHAWVVEALREIVAHVETFDLVHLRLPCRAAYEAAVQEIGPQPSPPTALARHQGFIDALRDLVDYAELAQLPRTRDFLLQALVSAAQHPQLSSTILRFPPRDTP